MRRAVLLAGILGFFSAATVVVECGIDEGGLEPPDGAVDGTTGDVVVDSPTDVPLDVPQGCTTLDASACVDSGLPDGWSYVGVANMQATCPTTGYTQQEYVDNLKLEAGACACGPCTTSGYYSCTPQLTVSTGGGPPCSSSATFDAGNDASCFDISSLSPDDHVQVILSTTFPTPVGVGCDASVVGGQGYTADTVTACTPTSCTADYCGLPSPFRRCILSTTEKTCPAPFTGGAGVVGPTSAVHVACEACSCRFASSFGLCTGSTEAYSDTKCSSGSDLGAATSACNKPSAGTNVGSIHYMPNVPIPGCALTDGGTGTVDFTSSITVCCLP